MKLFEKIFFKMVKKKIKKMFRNFSGKVSGKQWVMMIAGVLIAIVGFLKKKFGLEIDPVEVFSGLAPALAYFFGQLKNDLQRLKKGLLIDGRWRDAKFWTALIAAFLPVIAETFGVKMSAGIAAGFSGVITTILGVLFFKKRVGNPNPKK